MQIRGQRMVAEARETANRLYSTDQYKFAFHLAKTVLQDHGYEPEVGATAWFVGLSIRDVDELEPMIMQSRHLPRGIVPAIIGLRTVETALEHPVSHVVKYFEQGLRYKELLTNHGIDDFAQPAQMEDVAEELLSYCHDMHVLKIGLPHQERITAYLEKDIQPLIHSVR